MALCFVTKSVANTPYVLAVGEQCLQSIKTFCLPTLHPKQAGDGQQVGREHEHNSWPKLTQKDKANQLTSHSAIRTADLVFPTQPLFWDWPGISLLVDSGEWLLMNHLGLFRTLSFTSTVFISNHKYFTFALPILPLSLLRGGVSKWLDGCPVAGECQSTTSSKSLRMQKVQESNNKKQFSTVLCLVQYSAMLKKNQQLTFWKLSYEGF